MNSRVTTSMMYGTLISSLHENSRRVLDLQRQLSTMRKYARLSDNPAVIARSLNLEAALKDNKIYRETHLPYGSYPAHTVASRVSLPCLRA